MLGLLPTVAGPQLTPMVKSDGAHPVRAPSQNARLGVVALAISVVLLCEPFCASMWLPVGLKLNSRSSPSPVG